MKDLIPTPQQIKAARAWVGLRQPDFAQICGISVAALADYELGHRQTSQEVLLAIAAGIRKLKRVRIHKNGGMRLDA